MSYLNWDKKQAEINLQPGSGASPGSIKKDFSRGVLGLIPNLRHPSANPPLDVICLVHFKALATFLHFSENKSYLWKSFCQAIWQVTYNTHQFQHFN